MAQIHAQHFVDVVVQLLQRPFGSRSVADQKLTVQQPRPMPDLKIKTGDRSFQMEWYAKKDWLCGSVVRNGLFCWPCLLFKPGASQSWMERGYTNLRNVLPDGKKHEKSKSHLEAYKMWKTFDVSERVDVMFSRARREEIERHNDEVRQNRVCLEPLGMKRKIILDEQITESSVFNNGEFLNYGYNARLDNSNSWCSLRGSVLNQQWVKVDFRYPMSISGITIQGHIGHPANYIKKFKLRYSTDGTYYLYKTGNTNVAEEFDGANGQHQTIHRMFSTRPFAARYVEFRPTQFSGDDACVRFELYGCVYVCNQGLGLEHGVSLPSGFTMTSSSNQIGKTASSAHLNDASSCWCALNNDGNQYLQIDFGKPLTVTGLAIQGNPTADSWVKNFYFDYGMSLGSLVTYQEYGTNKLFVGNVDRSTRVVNWFKVRLFARYVRIKPNTWSGGICMRVEVVGCNSEYIYEVGAENRALDNGRFSASGHTEWLSGRYVASDGRLNNDIPWGITNTPSTDPWLKVDLGRVMLVNGISIQGDGTNGPNYFPDYKLQYSFDAAPAVGALITIKEETKSSVKVYPGNTNNAGVKFNLLAHPISTRHVQFRNNTAPRNVYTLRGEIYGQPQTCTTSFDMEAGSQSTHNPTIQVSSGSIPVEKSKLNSPTAWCAGVDNVNQFFEYDFGRIRTISGLAIQGHPVDLKWVKTFNVGYKKLQSQVFTTYKESGTNKAFVGCTSRNLIVYHWFSSNLRIRYLRIKPLTWNTNICLRLNAYGCPTDDCFNKLGISSNIIENAAISSSTHVSSREGHKGRLNYESVWEANESSGSKAWIQVCLSSVHKVTSIIVQGPGNFDNIAKVTKFSLSFGTNSSGSFLSYSIHGTLKKFQVFIGRYTSSQIDLPFAIISKCIRLQVESKSPTNQNVGLRWELLGCTTIPQASSVAITPANPSIAKERSILLNCTAIALPGAEITWKSGSTVISTGGIYVVGSPTYSNDNKNFKVAMTLKITAATSTVVTSFQNCMLTSPSQSLAECKQSYECSAINGGVSSSAKSNTTEVTVTGFQAKPSKPTGLSHSSLRSTSFSMSWAAAAPADFAIKDYKAVIKKKADNSVFVTKYNISSTNTSFNGLQAFTEYIVEISAQSTLNVYSDAAIHEVRTAQVNEPPDLSILNIQLKAPPLQGEIIGRVIGNDKEKTRILYGIQWVYSKILGRNVTEGIGFAGRECAEATKNAAPLGYICIDPNTGEVKATSEFKNVHGETLTVKVYAIDSGNPRKYSTRVFEIFTYDPCRLAKTQFKRLSTSCIGANDKYITARKNGSTLLFSGSGDRVVRIGINRNIVRLPSDTEIVRFILKQVISYKTSREYGQKVSVEYNNTAQNLQNKSDVQLPLVLSFEGAVEVELSAELYKRNSTSVTSHTLGSSGIRLYVHSFKATCGSTDCVAVYRSWLEESNKCGLDAVSRDPLFVHQYYKMCLDPLTFLLHPMNTSVPMKSVIRISCMYRNFTAVEFQWIKDGAVFKKPNIFNRSDYMKNVSSPSSNTQVLRIHGAEPDLQGYFHCMVKDALNHTVNSTKSLVRFTDVSTSRMVLNIKRPFSKALRNKASLQYKELSTGVTNALENMLDRSNMHKDRKIVIRECRPGSVVVSVDIYYMNVTEQGRRTLCSQFQKLSLLATDTDLDISSVKNISFDCCYKERTGKKNIKGVITWDQIIAGSFDKQACPYIPNKSRRNIPVNKASRFCRPNFISGAQWQAPKISECAYMTKTTFILEKLSQTNITDDNVEQIARKLASITNNEQDITNHLDVKFTADTIDNLVSSNKKLKEITKDIITSTSNMMDFDETYVAESQSYYKSSSKVLGSLDKLALQLELLPNATINASSKNLAFAVMPIKVVSEGIAIKSRRDHESGYTNVNFRTANAPGDQVSLTDAAQIWLPELLLQKAAQLAPKLFNRIYSFVFENDQLFMAKEKKLKALNSLTWQMAPSPSRKINSRILSASIGKIKLENLTIHEEMHGRFKILSKHPGECVYWDFSMENGFGAWSSNGCRSDGMEDAIQRCRCNHLTNFAILLDVAGKGIQQEVATALSIITYIGCAISLLCLLITLITFAVFKKLREKRPAQILISLCSALVLTIITFLAGIHANDKKRCQLFAVLIHYFVLASFMWMAVEGINHYLYFVRIVKDGISRFMLKSSIFAWGTSMIIVAISAATTKLESYGIKNKGDKWVCMVTGTAFYVAYLLPILLIVTANLVVMVFVIKSLKNSNQVSKDKRMTGLTMARIGAACSVLMGTTWIIGLFAVDVLTIPMQVLFCIFNSLQGFFIFIFYCARNKDAKKQWMDTFFSRDTEDSKSRSLGGNRHKVNKDGLRAKQRLIASTNF